MVRPITASTCRLSLRLRLKVHSSQVGPWLASCVRQRRRLLPSFSTGGRSNCMDGRVLSILGRQRNSLRCGICETDLLLSLLLPGSVENITNQLLPLSHWAWTELESSAQPSGKPVPIHSGWHLRWNLLSTLASELSHR